MRRSLVLVAAGVTSMVVIAFLVPLAILVGTLAFDRAVIRAEREAESIARLIAVLAPSAGMTGAASTIGEERLVDIGASMILPDGSVYGIDVPSGEDLSVALGGGAHRASVEGGEAVYLPVAQSDGDVTVVRVVAPHDELTSGVRRSWLILAGLGVVLVGLAVLAADQFGRSIVRPVRELSDAAGLLKQGDFSTRVAPAGPPEIQEVGAEFNQLAEQVEHLLQAERETAADLAHRLRTPLTAAKLDAEALSDNEDRDRLVEDLDELERTVDFIIGEGRRPVRTEIDPGCDLAVVAADRAAFWAPLSEEQGRPFTTTIGVAHAHIAVPGVDAGVMIDALLENVFAHTEEGVPIAICLSTGGDGRALLEVEDGGGGVTDPRATDRGASTGDSTGLGLDIARRTAEASGGSLELAEPGSLGGARVVVNLPLVRSQTD
ncbi:MAG: HAMP domain-containing sensor histidine kinase [Actinomycetota bacterium]|nr:HAMP domain-containing sensor histidine kinase [Actinomycetota bacterium]